MANKLLVAVIHYHLRPGGVTRVIERAVESLGDTVEILVLSGEAPAANDALTPITEPFQALEYADNATIPDTGKLADDLRFTARSLLGRDPDVWHIHNHSLGKNSFTPRLVWHLAKAGCRVLLQPHDFAEDGRPENYQLLRSQLGEDLDRILYPIADHVWYAPINYRDKAFLEGIGLSHVHELPNAVTAHPHATDHPPARTIVYPARAIRRKNMGEFLLWSLLAPEGYTFQSTLAPQNPKWQGYYNEWVAFAKELNLPIEFDAGRKTEFSTLISKAELFISTSIAEGFGLAFLEPWLEGKMLVGRQLPEITTDFVKEGLDLSMLYSTLPVPVEWAGQKLVVRILETAMKQSYAAYAKPWKNDFFEQAKNALIVDGRIDFGILDETMQRNVIRHLVKNPSDRDLLPTFRTSANEKLIAKNRTLVQERYSLVAYGERLLDLYQQLARTQPSKVTAAHPTKLLDAFLQPHRFNLLRT